MLENILSAVGDNRIDDVENIADIAYFDVGLTETTDEYAVDILRHENIESIMIHIYFIENLQTDREMILSAQLGVSVMN